jgi:REP element-mobilizing transposase RayT
MSKRKIPFVKDEYYHIYNRGNSKQKIFLDKEDYQHFIKLLFVCNSKINFKFRDNIVDIKIDAFEFERGENVVSIGAWVLMPNHFHLYLSINPHMSDMWGKDERNYISEFMRKILTSYVKYFNGKYKRTGSLFEGSFKAVHIENENQAKYLFSYIHLNPIKLIQKKWKEEGIKDIESSLEFLSKYKLSSYLDYKKVERKENKILNLEDFLDYFKNIKDFDNEILEWLKYKEE